MKSTAGLITPKPPFASASVLLLVSSLLVAHFLCLWLFNSPDNAIKKHYLRAINAYTMPYFYQNWSFFAPQPIDHDVELLVRGQTEARDRSPWLNVSRAMIAPLQANRLSHREIIVTSISNSLLSTVRLVALSRKMHSEPSYYDSPDARLLYRSGAAALRRQFPDRSFSRLQIAILTREFPRFDRRLDSDRNEKMGVAGLPWHAFPKKIEVLP